MLKIISSADGPVWVNGVYKLAGNSWHSEELTHSTVVHRAVDQSLITSTSLRLLIFSCQFLVQEVETEDRGKAPSEWGLGENPFISLTNTNLNLLFSRVKLRSSIFSF